MSVHKIEIASNHTIALIGDARVLIDTGSPFSIGRVGELDFAGAHTELLPAVGGLSIEQVCELAGFEVDVLLGGDVLRQCCFRIDWGHRSLVTSRRPLHEFPSSPPRPRAKMHLRNNVPLLDLSLHAEEVRTFLDTGAAYSYLRQDFALAGTVVAHVTDYHPSVGRFETDLVALPVLIASQELKVRFGRLPAGLDQVLSVTGVSGILGSDVLANFAVTFDYLAASVYLDPVSAHP